MQTTKQRHKLARYITLTLLTGMLVSTTAYALPQNGQVAAGSGSITQNGATMTVQQNTARMGVNWQSFNIAKSETVNFRQPNASSVALNRVLGNDASAIYGSLNANGKVFLVNPNGVMFAPGASVNVGGIVASTKDISDANFMAGKYNFAGSSTAGVTNQGSINVADGGYVALLANNVTNAGAITAPKGSVALGAGNAFTLSTDGTGKVNLAVDEAAVNAAAVNKGTIKADGGYVVMKATDAASVLNSVVTNTGVIEARSLKNDKGEIVLDGGSQGIVNVGGKLDTSAAEANTAAGNLTVKGQYTNINAGAELYAKATGTQTGGTIETSGDALYVDPTATINAASEKGMGGTWLLDPLYVEIDSDTSGSAWSATTYTNNSDSAKTTHVLASSIVNSLNAGTGVAITATDKNGVADILVEAPIAKTAGGDASLTLKAQREIRIDADITSTSGKLDMTFWSDSNDDAKKSVASGAVILNANLDSHGGDILMGSGQNITDGVVGTYIGLKESELKALIASDTKTDRNITTLGGNVKVYGDLLLATGDYTNINTVAADGTKGGSVYVSGLIDSGNFYKAINWTENLSSLTDHGWSDAETQAKGKTSGGSDLWDTYLTNITSNLENSVIESVVNKKNLTTAYYIGGYTDISTSYNRTWYWKDGPEAGKSFFIQTGSGTGTDGDYTYHNWHAGEPNNAGGQTAATIGYGWDSKWDDNVAANRHSGSTIEIPGYIQETNMLRSALKINAGSGDVYLKGNIGSQRSLWELDVTNTGKVTTGGSVQLSGDYYKGVQKYADMNINSTGDVTMVGFVDATGNINIGYDKDGNAVAPGNVTAGSTLTAENGAVVIGSADKRAASASLGDKVFAGTGVSIYTNGDVTANGIEAKGADTSTLGSGLTTPKVLGDIVINDSKENSIITLNNETKVDSTDDSKDDITLYGDKMALNGAVTTNANTGVVTVSNYTQGNTIDLGSTVDTTDDTLELSDAEIDNITASKLVVGNNTSGTATKNINITNAITPAGTSVVHMYTGVVDEQNKGQIKETTPYGTLAPGASRKLDLAITADTQVYLDNANNITTFADASSGDTANDTIRLNNGANTLTIGTVDGVTGVTTDVAGNKDAVILATSTSFVNNVGSNCVSVPTTSNWRIFSNSPEDDTFGPGEIKTYLSSGSYADWQTPYKQGTNVGTQDGGIDNEDDTANHYIFAVDKTIVVRPVSQTKNYGEDYTSNGTYGDKYTKGVLGTNYIYVADIYDTKAANDKATVEGQLGSVTLDSTGFNEKADVGIYEMTATLTGTASGTTTNGYRIVAKGGEVNVVPIPLTINVTATREYGDNTKSGNKFTDVTYGVDNANTAKTHGLESWDVDKYNTYITNAADYVDNTEAATDAGVYSSTTGKYLALTDTVKNNAVTNVLKNYIVTYKDTYNIDKAELVINVTGTRDYGDTTKSGNVFSDAAYTIDNTGLKAVDTSNYASLTKNVNSIMKDNTVATTNAGTYDNKFIGTDAMLTLTDSVKKDSFLKNYDVKYTDTYTINKVALDLTISGSKEYGAVSSSNGADYTMSATDATQLKNGETLSTTGTGLTINNTVTIYDAANTSYYNNYDVSGTTTTSGHNASVDSGTPTGANGFDVNNYTITYHTKYDVTPAPLDVTVTGSREYGDASSTDITKYNVSTGNGQLKNGETITTSGLTVANSVSTTDNVGSYYKNYTGAVDTTDNASVSGTLTGTDGFDANNYTVTYHTKYDVTPAPLAVNVTGHKTYGSDTPTSGSGYDTMTADKLKNGETINKDGSTVTNTVGKQDGVGSYTDTVTGVTNMGFDSDNYNITYTSTYTIDPAPLTIEVKASRTYGDTKDGNIFDTATYTVDKSGTAQANGLMSWDAAAYDLQMTDNKNNFMDLTTSGTNAKTSYVDQDYVELSTSAKNAAVLKNYTVTYHDTYTVNPAPLTITVDNKSMTQGEAVPALTDVYSGFRNGDTPASIDDNGIYTTGTSTSAVGKYPIEFSGLPNNPNYSITLIPGTLTINAVVNPPDPHVNPNPSPDPKPNPDPTTPTNPVVVPNTPTNYGVNNSGIDDGGFDRNIVRESMPVYTVTPTATTRVGAYDVADDKDGVKMHPTMNTVPDPADDKSESRTTIVAYTRNKVTGQFKIVFDGSIVKVYPQDAGAKEMVAETKESRYVDIYRGALNTALNDMGVILQSVRAMYLVL